MLLDLDMGGEEVTKDPHPMQAATPPAWTNFGAGPAAAKTGAVGGLEGLSFTAANEFLPPVRRSDVGIKSVKLNQLPAKAAVVTAPPKPDPFDEISKVGTQSHLP